MKLLIKRTSDIDCCNFLKGCIPYFQIHSSNLHQVAVMDDNHLSIGCFLNINLHPLCTSADRPLDCCTCIFRRNATRTPVPNNVNCVVKGNTCCCNRTEQNRHNDRGTSHECECPCIPVKPRSIAGHAFKLHPLACVCTPSICLPGTVQQRREYGCRKQLNNKIDTRPDKCCKPNCKNGTGQRPTCHRHEFRRHPYNACRTHGSDKKY